MRWLKMCLLAGLLAGSTVSSEAGTGKIVKVLPHLLDEKGRNTLSPSLYERDAYQAELRKNRDKCSAIRFDVQWKSTFADKSKLRIKLEVNTSTTKGKAPMVLEHAAKSDSWIGNWTGIKVEGDAFKSMGEVISWRATLWEGDTQLAEQKSFLW